MNRYILSIDQSTSGTKALLFDEDAKLCGRTDLPHQQIIQKDGWVEHDPIEIRNNVFAVVRNLLEETQIAPETVQGIAVSNQRETVMAWNRETGEPIYHAIVWQCARAEDICKELAAYADIIRSRTGLHLSPYFSAAKAAWIMRHVPEAKPLAEQGTLNIGTMDSWVIWCLTNGQTFATDYSNASRTQLYNIESLKWDAKVCGLFGIPVSCLAEVRDSNACYGYTDCAGLFPQAIPIHGVLGDSHGALYGQGCEQVGGVKTTYGTGSSVMMNVGATPIRSKKGVVTSLAWGIDGRVTYVLEGNINYTGAVMKWITEELGLLEHPKQSGSVAQTANPEDTTYLVPAFSGLGAPYWDSKATAILYGMTRSTGKAEIVKAAEECIAYQITDIISLMQAESGLEIKQLCVDGGPTRDQYLMQFQSDLLNLPVLVPEIEELSGIGPAYLAGVARGIYAKEVSSHMQKSTYLPSMPDSKRKQKIAGWQTAVKKVLTN